MMNRCLKPNHNKFKYYGGKGIKVCPQWSNFAQFLADMGLKPNKKHSIDRIDTNGDYCPENCRWADAKTQNRNTSRNFKVFWQGVFWVVTDLSMKYRIPLTTLTWRLRKGWPIEQALGLQKR
jgi:hypothetical protein